MKHFCQVCKKESKNQCSRCQKVRYCSVDCQKQDWKDHKLVCQPPTLTMDQCLSHIKAQKDLLNSIKSMYQNFKDYYTAKTSDSNFDPDDFGLTIHQLAYSCPISELVKELLKKGELYKIFFTLDFHISQGVKISSEKEKKRKELQEKGIEVEEEDYQRESDLTSYQFCFFTSTILKRLALSFESSNQSELFELGKESCKQLCVLNSTIDVRKSCGSALTENFVGILSIKKYRSTIIENNGINAAIRDVCEDHIYGPRASNFLQTITIDEWKKQSEENIKTFLIYSLEEGHSGHNFVLFTELIQNASIAYPLIFKSVCEELKNKYPVCNYLCEVLDFNTKLETQIQDQMKKYQAMDHKETKKYRYATYSEKTLKQLKIFDEKKEEKKLNE